jgi:hypothetical protein
MREISDLRTDAMFGMAGIVHAVSIVTDLGIEKA